MPNEATADPERKTSSIKSGNATTPDQPQVTTSANDKPFARPKFNPAPFSELSQDVIHIKAALAHTQKLCGYLPPSRELFLQNFATDKQRQLVLSSMTPQARAFLHSWHLKPPPLESLLPPGEISTTQWRTPGVCIVIGTSKDGHQGAYVQHSANLAAFVVSLHRNIKRVRRGGSLPATHRDKTFVGWCMTNSAEVKEALLVDIGDMPELLPHMRILCSVMVYAFHTMDPKVAEEQVKYSVTKPVCEDSCDCCGGSLEAGACPISLRR